MKVSNVKIYGLAESVAASGYPMSVDPDVWKMLQCEKEARDKWARAEKLGSTPCGEGHDQYLTGIVVQFDVDFTIKAWTEAERYHFLDFVSSTSTMHKLMSFDLDDAYVEYVDDVMIERMKALQRRYNETKDRDDYLRMIYSNPCGMRLTARLTTNYRQLKTIYKQRKNHRLPEWREFCEWILTLPEFNNLTGVANEQTTAQE